MTDGTTRTRRDVWQLGTWDPILLWYAKAVAAMQARPIIDPASWRYQAAIHGYDPNQDPNPTNVSFPSSANQARFWNQCQHSSWFFLPWHRMYLHYFEQIVAATVASLGGPSDWSLPYWNYSDESNPNARQLPPAFTAHTMPDGSANPLQVADRNSPIDIGPREVSLSCLRDLVFTGVSAGAHPGFGGPRTQFSHGGGPVGGLEMTPHGDIHVAVGGLMGSFETAGLDPIFWLHHANIDRLWEVWRQRDPRLANPTGSDWLGASFEFHDASENIVSLTPSQIVDTSAALLGYQYQDISDPLAAPAMAAAAPRSSAMAATPLPAELVGATASPIALAAALTTAHVAITPPTGPALRAGTPAAAPQRVYLNIENITGRGRPTSYAVYLNIPDGATDPHQHEHLFAGNLPMFGVAEASRSDAQHTGSGLTYVLDITELVEQLKAQGVWDPARLRVTFAPRRAPAEGAAIQVGRISLYYQ
jgi:tyrosinase